MQPMENPAENVRSALSAISSDPQKWRTLLDQFEDVLKTNIFIVDPLGQILVPLNSKKSQPGQGSVAFGEGHFGSSLIERTFEIEFSQEGGGLPAQFLNYFEPLNAYFWAENPFSLRLFAVPVRKEGEALFYIMIGPLRLGKAWADDKYLDLAQSLGFGKDILEQIKSVAQISEAALEAILDLLSEIVKDVYELAVEKQKLSYLQNTNNQSVRPEILSAVQSLLVDIQHDELLVAILDAAIKMAGAEGGSIMTFDEERNDFVVKVSRGLDKKKSSLEHRFKFGEGIAGIAAQEKTPFFITGMEGDERIRHLLKRSDIRQSFVVPILVDEKVMGVLNLSIKNLQHVISLEEVQGDIQKFSPFIAAALRSL
jgi:putative methionine-R-sulfoxide reductase with GAF domain